MIKQFFQKILFLLCIVFWGTGCAVHAPMSELGMMHRPATSTKGFSVTFGSGIPLYKNVRSTLYPDLRGRQLPVILALPHQINLTFSRTLYASPVAAVSFSGGLLSAGLDLTHKLTPFNHLTVGFSAPEMYQLFLHQRIMQDDNGTVALSIGARRERFSFNDPDSYGFIVHHAPSLGVKLQGTFRSLTYPRRGTRVQLYVGHIPDLDQTVFEAAFSFGRFWR